MLTPERIKAGVDYYRRVTGDTRPVDIKIVDRPDADADQESFAYINAVTGEIHLVESRADGVSLMHELVHLWQIRRGSLRVVPVGHSQARTFFDGEEVTKCPYWHLPSEDEARQLDWVWAGKVEWPKVLRLKPVDYSCILSDVEEVPAVDFSRYANA